MTFDPTNARAVIDKRRLTALYASDIGDDTAGGSNTVLMYMDARRNFRGFVANVAARNALASPATGDAVVVLAGANGTPTFDVYNSGSWTSISGGGQTGVLVPVRAATTTALSTNNYNNANGTLTCASNASFDTIDGLTIAVGESVLVKNEANGTHNGIYTLTNAGSGATAWVLTRRTDANTSAEVLPSIVVYVQEGTLYADTQWQLTTNGPITLGTTSLTWTQFSAGGAMSQLLPCTPATGDGVTTTFQLPGTGTYELVYVDGSPQPAAGTNQSYTRSGQNITFNSPPANGAPVLASTSIGVLAGTDAQTLGGHAASYFLAATAQAADSAALQGHPASYFLAATAQAADSAQLGGVAAATYMRKDQDYFTQTFEASGAYPSTFTNIGPAWTAPFAMTVIGATLLVESNGSGGGYSEFDLVAGASGSAPASVLTNKPRVPGNGGVWGSSDATVGAQAATVATANWAAGTVFSVNITSGANQPPTTAPVSATLVLKYRRQ